MASSVIVTSPVPGFTSDKYDLFICSQLIKWVLIVSTSFKDHKCNNYPRFKKIDDITVIKMIKEM